MRIPVFGFSQSGRTGSQFSLVLCLLVLCFMQEVCEMKKNLNAGPVLFPQPVLPIATYGEDGTVDVMTMAWGGMSAGDRIALNISKNHKTTKNIRSRKAFTISVADLPHLVETDFFGIESGNNDPKKFEKSGLHAVKSEHVDAPVIEEYPLTVECEVESIDDSGEESHIIGKIINVLADEDVLSENGKIDVTKLNAFCFDMNQNRYFAIGDQVGKAWHDGTALMKK